MKHSRPILAGRHEERRIIEQSFEEAREGRGVALFLEGFAGSGKSRLVEHALAEAARHGWLALFGIAGEGQEDAPYGLLLDAFRRYLRRDTKASPPWADPCSPWMELVAFRPAPALQGPTHAFHEICRLLAQHSGAVLLALEDLHQADRASLDIVEWLARELATRPIFLLATCRSEGLMDDSDRAVRVHRLLRLPRVRHLRLGGLSLAETREFVDAILPVPGDHGFLARQLHRRTEGNPLFLEELLHGIMRDGTGADAPLPVSFRTAVRSRLGALARDDIRLLQFASVIGEWFDLATLAFLGRRTAGAVRTALTRLCDQRLIRENPDRNEFKFWHALTRDVLYEQLPVPDRRALHRRVAQHGIGASGHPGEAPASAIAYHLEKAGEEADAAPYYATAAQRAAELCAFDEAFAHAERAFAFSPADRRTHALHASRYARMAGQIGAALRYCHTAQSLLGDTSDPLLRAEVWLHESDLHWLKGDGARAAALLREVAGLRVSAGRAVDAPVWAWLLAREAQRAGLESRWSDVFEPADAAIAMCRRLALPIVEAHALISRSMAEVTIDGTERALATLQRARALAEQHGSVEDICRAYVVEVDMRSSAGDFAAAGCVAVEGTERARRAGAPVVLFPTLAAAAVEFLWKTGRWQEALDRLPETERLVNAQPSDLVRCHFRCVLAGIAIDRDRLADAGRFLTEAMETAQAIQESQWALPPYLTAARLALTDRRPGDALQQVKQAWQRFPHPDPVDAAELRSIELEAFCANRGARRQTGECNHSVSSTNETPTGGRVLVHHTALALGFRAMLAGKFSAAVTAFRRAASLASAMDCPVAEARAREWLVQALRQQGGPSAKQEAIAERTRARALVAAIPGRRGGGDSPLALLSAREREVARLVADGLANKQVGAELAISERTVAVHLSRIFGKLGVDSRHRLAALLRSHK